MTGNPVEKNQPKKRVSRYYWLLFFIGIISVSFCFIPRVTKAQWVVSAPVIEQYLIQTDVKKSIWQKIKDNLKVATDVAFKNSLRTFFGKVAEDTAVWIASAGTGQKPLFLTKPFEYFKGVGDAAVGDMLYTLGAHTFGVDVCEPDLSSKISITLALGATFNLQNWCQDSCRSTSNSKISAIDTKYNGVSTSTAGPSSSDEGKINYLKYYDTDAKFPAFAEKVSFTCPIHCPTLDHYPGLLCANPAYTETGGDVFSATRENLQGCIATLQYLMDQEKQKIVKDTTLCLKNCSLGKRTAKCTASAVFKNMSDLKNQLKNSDVNNLVGLYFQPQQNDIGQLLTLYGLIEEKKISSIDAEQLLYQNQVGPVTAKVTREVLSPAEAVKARLNLALDKGAATEEVYTGSWKADMVTIFTNTLINKLIQRFYGGKCALNPSAEACKGPSGGSKLSQIMFGGGPTGIAAAKLQFASISKLNFTRGSPGQDPIEANDLVSRGLIDSGFQTAIDQELTVKEAIDKGMIGGTFGFDAEGREPTIDSGVPYRSILYMLNYRVVPVGWKLAAEWIKDHPQNITLEKLATDEFSRCDAANSSPFCGLVDPDWVLKMPATYCQKRGAAEEILSKEFICDEDTNNDTKIDCSGTNGDIGHWQIVRNTDTCASEVSCLQEDSQGKCKIYGTCFEEKSAWRFNGDECSRVYASCQSYTQSDGTTISYLKNTLDMNGCNAGNAGCRWYCQDPDYNPTSKQWLCTRDAGSKINFDRDVQTCSETEVGCQEFITTGEAVGTNLFFNSSFEYYTGQVDDGVYDLYDSYSPGYPTLWAGNLSLTPPYYTCGAAVEAVSDAYTGGSATKLTWLSDCINTPPDTGHYLVASNINTGHSVLNRTFTFSFYAKGEAGTTLITHATQGKGGNVVYKPNHQYGLSTDWQRFSFSETFDQLYPNNSAPLNPNYIQITFAPLNGHPIYLDGLQVEEGGLSNYKDFGSENKIYLNKDRLACSEKDVGCDQYTPVKGGAAIPGVVYSQNMCTADKVGCQSYRETAIANIPQRAQRDPVYFTAGTGTTCPNTAVGCEEYTNLDEVARGGEGKEYFQQIRQCIKPVANNGVANYYAWEGSDTAGFQLRAFRYKQSNINNYNAETGLAPCTNLEVAASNVAVPQCLDGVAGLAPAVCTAAEMATNPDCTEFYDTAGHIFYRLRSRIIEETDQCFPYRNTIDTQENPGSDHIYFINPNGSLTCSANQAGCREYKGNTSDVTRVVFQDNFEKVDLGAVNWTSGSLSNESVRANEHSLHVTGTNVATSIVSPNVLRDGKIANGQYYKITFWLKPDTATIINSAQIQNTNAASGFPGLPVGSLANDWNKYTFGPLHFDREPTDTEQLVITANGSFYLDNVILEEMTDTVYLIQNTYVSCAAADLGCQEYKNRAGASKYIKSFDHLCAEKFVGCQALINTQNSTSPVATTVKGVTTAADTYETWVNDSAKYCPAAAKGCNRFGLPTLNALDQPASWETKYLINDPDKYSYFDTEGNDKSIICLSSEEGCDEYQYSNGSGVSWFKDPRSKICEYKLISDATEYRWYKKGTNLPCPYLTPPPETRPTGKACVKACQGGDYPGVSCVSNADCKGGGVCGGNGNNVGVACTSNSDCVAGNICDYWAGLCPENQSGCNEYRDPSDPANCRSNCSLVEIGGKPVPVDENCQPSATGAPGCRSYYYIKDTVEANKEECGNTVNPAEGCLPFNDTSNTILNMRGQ